MRQLGFENADTIAQRIIERFEAGEFDVATLFYSRFRSVIAQVPTAQQIIPDSPAAAENGSQAHRLLLGSVSTAIVARAHCTVEIVRK